MTATNKNGTKTKKIKVVVYGEEGQYCTCSHEKEVYTVGTDRAIKTLAKKAAKEWAVLYDNWGGWHEARVAVFKGSLEDFESKYNKKSEPHYITGCQYRLGVFDECITPEEKELGYTALNF